MTPANYDKHFKALGKIVRLYDDGGGDLTAMQTLVTRLYDQVATGELPSYEALQVLNPFAGRLDDAIGSTAEDLRARAKEMATAYLVNSLFRDDLTTTPSSPTNAASVLDALAADMSAGEDNKTLTDEAATGLVNFFKNALGASAAWNTAADVSADYKDSVYVVTTIV